MILTYNRGLAECGELFGDAVVATAPLNRLLPHAATAPTNSHCLISSTTLIRYTPLMSSRSPW